MEAEIFEKSNRILKTLLGNDATFREGQYEAIEATMTKKRTLVVQRTGWGKSLIYFACTRLLREQGKGVTLVISPLLVLMKNQLEAANRLGLSCDVLNKTTVERHGEILEKIKNGALDLVLVTPETLFKDDVKKSLLESQIGLFVIDEAHCISDWGHDFRPEYGRLREVISLLDKHVHILATTATANNRVIRDLVEQLGSDVFVSRGPLTRESLSIQVLNMPSRVERYAWILENINKLEGSGIIYCLTKRDCDYLADFLQRNGINAVPYYSEKGTEEKMAQAEELFAKNEVKAIVATIKLGMGYDKGDISFVIHYQMPSNIVSYYQQIGRAGRNIENASVFLMYGKEDMDIVNYFIDTIFPTEQDANDILNLIKSSKRGVRQRKIEGELNITKRRIERTLEYLLFEGVIELKKSSYVATGKELFYDSERYSAITEARRQEARQMRQMLTHKGCLSRYIVNCIDDFTAEDCHKCENCKGAPLLPKDVSLKAKEISESYINRLSLIIEPRKMWLGLENVQSSKLEYVNEQGICLSQYGEVGYGTLAKHFVEGGELSGELVGRATELLRPVVSERNIRYITYVPSRRNERARQIAQELSKRLGLMLVHALEKKPAPRQEEMENNAHRCENAYNSFEINSDFEPTPRPEPSKEGEKKYERSILLVDDTVDSRFTLTVCGYRLYEAGFDSVTPFALASKE